MEHIRRFSGTIKILHSFDWVQRYPLTHPGSGDRDHELQMGSSGICVKSGYTEKYFDFPDKHGSYSKQWCSVRPLGKTHKNTRNWRFRGYDFSKFPGQHAPEPRRPAMKILSQVTYETFSVCLWKGKAFAIIYFTAVWGNVTIVWETYELEKYIIHMFIKCQKNHLWPSCKQFAFFLKKSYLRCIFIEEYCQMN